MVIRKHTNEIQCIDLATIGLPEIPLLGRARLATSGSPLKPHIHRGLMEIHYLKMGEQVFNVEGVDYTLKSGDVFVTLPPERHSTGKALHGKNIWYWTQFFLPEKPAEFMFMSAKTAWPIVQQLRQIPCRHFRANKRVESLYREIFTLVESPASPMKVAQVASRYMLWLQTVIECSKRSDAIMRSDDINSVVAMIESQPEEKYSIGALAELAGLSVSRFKGKFKQQTGMPPHEFMLRIKVKRAYEMLQTTDKSITEIAFYLNFPSSQHFATVFRRFYNTSPRDVRKK